MRKSIGSENQTLYTVPRCRPVLDRDGEIRSVGDLEIVPDYHQRDITCRNPAIKIKNNTIIAVCVCEDVVSVIGKTKKIGVIAHTSIKPVVACSSIQSVMTCKSDQIFVVSRADKSIILICVLIAFSPQGRQSVCRNRRCGERMIIQFVRFVSGLGR